jgi:hypothetical protein
MNVVSLQSVVSLGICRIWVDLIVRADRSTIGGDVSVRYISIQAISSIEAHSLGVCLPSQEQCPLWTSLSLYGMGIAEISHRVADDNFEFFQLCHSFTFDFPTQT